MEGQEIMAKHKHDSRGEAIAKQLMESYDPKSAEDIQDIFNTIFGPIFETMLKGELDTHLGYSSNDHSTKETDNRRNGTTPKTLKTSMGSIPINSPRDRDGSFTPTIVPKRVTDVSNIEGKILSMYAKGMSQRDIQDIIKDIYGFEISPAQISIITDNVLMNLPNGRHAL